jgi:phosphoglycolate phosphatase-like HAD superfamily hydrolase
LIVGSEGAPVTRALLFDIDQTLLYTGGAGGHAMNLAFEKMFGVSDGFGKVEFSGRTDLSILEEGLCCHGIEGGAAAHLEEFLRIYHSLLPEALREKDGYLMPGFPELLEKLAGQDVRMGLGTGNFAGAARIKLEHYGIAKFFSGGGFGEASLERADVIRAAIEQVADGVARDDILVIGDTPKDVSAALENGVVAVGVATGSYSTYQLREAGAHLVFEDFSDWGAAAAMLAP